MRTLSNLFLFLVFLAFATSCLAGTVIQDRHSIIVSDKGSLDIANHFLKKFPQIKTEVEGSLGLRLQSRPTLKLVENPTEFEKMSGSPYIAAFAVPHKSLIVMRTSPADLSNLLLLNDTLKHELCHLVLHENITGSNLPKWLDEGVCQWVSGTIGEFLVQGNFAPMDFNRDEIPLATLSGRFPDERRKLALAYWQSRTFVQYLSAHYGRKSVISILQSLKAGEDIDSALASNLNRTLKTLESSWRRSQSGLNMLLIWLSQYLYEIIFFLAALLAVLSFIWRKAFISRRYQDENDEEDENEDYLM
ncbi:MAG: hypothetical protein WCA08_03935 [Desulfoferrobacter sp.]